MAPRLFPAYSSVHVEDGEDVSVSDHKDVVIDQELGEQLYSVVVWAQQGLLWLDLRLAQHEPVRVEEVYFSSVCDEEQVAIFANCICDHRCFFALARLVCRQLVGVLVRHLLEVEVRSRVDGVVAGNEV